jgi:hypothetical protein
MRVRDHVALSTAGALALAPRAGRGILGPWAASILVDVDHYLWFCVRRRTLNPLAAVRYFNGPHPENHAGTRLLHSPGALYAGLLLGTQRRRALGLALGVAAHVALDSYYEARLREARDAALRRDDFTCQECGARDGHVETHLQHQPPLLPSFRPHHFVSLCPCCHETAHARPTVESPASPLAASARKPR